MFAAFGDVQRAFLLSRIIAVVIHAEQIAVRIKGQLLRVPFAAGKTFHIGAIQFAAKNTAAIRPMNFHTLRGGQRMPLVSQRPVHTPVRPHRQSAEIMPALTDVQRVTGADDLWFLRKAIAVRVAITNHIRLHRHVHIIAHC